MVGLGEKLGTNKQIDKPSSWGLGRGPFSWEQWLCSSLLVTSRKVAIRGLREIRTIKDHMRTERGKCMAC
jgi:hypothetical protein